MAQGGFGISSSLIEARQVEMRVGQLRIECKGLTICKNRLGLPVQILQKDRKIEDEYGSGPIGRAIELLRLLETSGDMQQPA